MSVSVTRRQWLVQTGLVAGAAALRPGDLGALDVRADADAGYAQTLLRMERDVTALRRAAGPIRLHFNENPYGMSPKARAAINTGWAEHSQYDPPSYDALVASFAQFVGVEPANVLVTQGSGEVLSIAALAYARQGGDIVIPWPTFEGLPDYGELVGATIQRVALDGDLQHDLAAMDTRITNSARLVFVCNPNNPTGTLAKTAALKDFIRSVSRRAIVVVDEAYHDFVDDPGYESMISLVREGANVIVSRTASKVHGFAGTRIGWAVARPDIIERLAKFVTGAPNALGLNAAIAAVADTEYQSFVKGRNREGRTMLTSALTGMGRRVVPSQTNFVFFQAGMPTERVQATMKAKGFLIGRTFRPFLDWCRISIGTPEEMRGCVAALPEALRA